MLLTPLAEVIGSDDAQRLVPAVRKHVRRGANVYTDAASAYGDLALSHWREAIDHSRAYAIGVVHINGLENFWSLLKRALGGTYIAVAPFHLFHYTAQDDAGFMSLT